MADEEGGVVGAASRLGQALIGALPPAFLLLVLINAAFISMVLYFIDAQLEERMKLVDKLVDHCFAAVDKMH